MNWTDKEMICHRGLLPVTCEPNSASGCVAVRFWCPRCKRWPRDDRWHIVQLREDLVPTLEELRAKMSFHYRTEMPIEVAAKICAVNGIRFRRTNAEEISREPDAEGEKKVTDAVV